METETKSTNEAVAINPDNYRMVRRGRGQNVHLVPLKSRKGRGRRSLKQK